MTVLIRPPMPASRATRYASIDEEPEPTVDDLLLHRARQVVPHDVGAVRAVQQNGRPRLGTRQHVEAREECELVTGDEGRPLDQVGRPDGPRSEAEVEMVTDPAFFES